MDTADNAAPTGTLATLGGYELGGERIEIRGVRTMPTSLVFQGERTDGKPVLRLNPDGTVEANFTDPNEAVEQFVAALSQFWPNIYSRLQRAETLLRRAEGQFASYAVSHRAKWREPDGPDPSIRRSEQERLNADTTRKAEVNEAFAADIQQFLTGP